MRKLAGVISLVAMIAFIVLVWSVVVLTVSGLSIGAANAWVLQGTFSAGWHAVWDRPLVAIGWSLLFGGSKLMRLVFRDS